MENVNKSTSLKSKSGITLHNPCTQSTWRWHLGYFLTSLIIDLISLIVPKILLTHIIETKIVSLFNSFFNSSISTRPSSFISKYTTSYLSLKFLIVLYTDGCSAFVVIILPFSYLYAIPWIAKLLASVAPLVKITSFSLTFNKLATWLTAAFKRPFDFNPSSCKELELAK